MMMRRLCVLSAVGCVRAIATTSTLRMRNLGSSTLRVTEACLGTMTWGVQNTESEAHEQLDYAIKERGINFIDTAELYPVPLTVPSGRGHHRGIHRHVIEANPEWR